MIDIKLEDVEHGLDHAQLKDAIYKSLNEWGKEPKKVLLIPPDFTRSHSCAGIITSIYYHILKDRCEVNIMPALGTHMPMSDKEITAMFGDDIPKSCFIDHRWREDIVKLGEVPGAFISDVSEGLLDRPIDVEVNKRLVSGEYDLIISIGQVVPHEVVGMANYSKNIFVGCGGRHMIDGTHILGAVYGLERMMGRDNTPVRKVLDYAQEHFISSVPLLYVLTVTTQGEGQTLLNGLYIGNSRKTFERAVALSQRLNLTFVDEPFNKVVVYLDEDEFKSTWLGNKAVYRTRMAIADGGELIILAPGVRQFGEDMEIDRLIRKYGYLGRDKVLKMLSENEDLMTSQSVAAHLIHGSSDGRFSITYAVQHLSKEEIEGVNFKYMALDEAYKKYNPRKLKDGYNTLKDGDVIYYISNPALGLWADKSRF